eukprot:6550447-Pyramimonas_sp.AAC.3
MLARLASGWSVVGTSPRASPRRRLFSCWLALADAEAETAHPHTRTRRDRLANRNVPPRRARAQASRAGRRARAQRGERVPSRPITR